MFASRTSCAVTSAVQIGSLPHQRKGLVIVGHSSQHVSCSVCCAVGIGPWNHGISWNHVISSPHTSFCKRLALCLVGCLIVSRDDASKVEGFAKNQRPLIECIANQVGAMIRRENESSEASGFRQWRGPRGRLTKKTPVPLLAPSPYWRGAWLWWFFRGSLSVAWMSKVNELGFVSVLVASSVSL